jgi:hypothetical protein
MAALLAGGCGGHGAVPDGGPGGDRDGGGEDRLDLTDLGPADGGGGADGDAAGGDGGGDGAGPSDLGDAGADGGGPVAQVVSQDPTGLFEGETEIAAAPDGTVGVVWIATRTTGTQIGYALSHDGGRQFGPVGYLETPDGLDAGDPTIVAAPDGTLHVAWLSLHYQAGAFVNTRIYAASAAPGATSFGAAVLASVPGDTGFHDRPQLALTRAGTLLIAYHHAPDSTGQALGLMVTRSTDGGQSWQQAVLQPATAANDVFFFPFLCTPAATGSQVFAIYAGLSAALPYAAYLRRSDDDGVTFGDPVSFSSSLSAPAGIRLYCVTEGQELAVSYGLSSDPNGGVDTLQKTTQFLVLQSTDGGMNFGTPVDAVDHDVAPFAMHTALGRKGDGSLQVVGYAGQGQGDAMATLRWRTLGASGWTPSEELAGPLTLETRRPPATNGWLGDYIGIAPTADALLASYTDNSSGTAHVAVVRMPWPR